MILNQRAKHQPIEGIIERITIGYARVSTAEQAYKIALSTQVYRLRNAGAVKVYADIASRTKDNRAGIAEIINLVESGVIGKVLITRLDRITSSPGLFERLSAVLQKHNVELEALDEHVDIYSPDGEFSAGLQVYFSRREVRTIQMRVKKAIEAGRERNKASNKAPWGYRSVNGHYELDHTPMLCLLSDRPPNGEEFSGRTKAQLGRDVVDLFFSGGSLYEAVRLINSKYGIEKFKTDREVKLRSQVLVFDDDLVEFKPTTNKRSGVFRWSTWGIKAYLSNPVLCGHTPYHVYKSKGTDGSRRRLPKSEWDIRFNTHSNQTIMTDLEQQRVEEILSGNQKIGNWSGKKSRVFPLTGIIACGVCGRTMKCEGLKEKNGRRFIYYQCKNSKEKACPNKLMVRLDKAEQSAIEKLVDRAAAITAIAQTPDSYVESPELIQLKNQLIGLEKLGNNPAIEAAKIELRQQIESLKYKQEQIVFTNSVNRDLLLRTFSDRLFWECISDEDKRLCYQNLVERVVVRDGVVEKVELRV